MIGAIMNRVNEQLSLLRQYSGQNNLSLICVIVDYISCRIFHGYSLDDYIYNSDGPFTSGIFRSRFFSFRRWKRLLDKFNDRNEVGILDDKVKFLKQFDSYINHAWLYPKGGATFADFQKFIGSNQEIIRKPVTSIYGLGVSEFKIPANVDEEYYSSICKQDILLEERIKQHPLLIFGNSSVNTIRVYSILDRNNEVHVLKAVLRVGVGNSIVDNFHAGGVIYPISIEYGMIESFGVQKVATKRIFYHPYTNQCMLGYKIPSWEKVIALVKEAHIILPKVRYIGWDIVVLENGEVDIIEANSNADHALFGRIGYDKLFYKKIKRLL